MGLPSMLIYAKAFQIEWDIEQYKKDLPRFEAKQKEKEIKTGSLIYLPVDSIHHLISSGTIMLKDISMQNILL